VSSGCGSGRRWLKAEMHAHCNLDPKDYGICRHTPEQLIEEAAGQGFDILAITCHDSNIWSDALSSYAGSFGITLIPGMEVTAEKSRHVLLYNFEQGANQLDTLEKIGRHADSNTLVVAPHPFFPGNSSLRHLLEQNMDMFDGIEYSGFVIPGLNFNRRGIRLSQRSGKPLLGFGDVHHLWQLGKTCTYVYAEPDIPSILDAIRRRQVRVATSPLSWFEASGWWAERFYRAAFPANSPPSNEIEDRGRFGAAYKRVKPQSVHIGEKGQEVANDSGSFQLPPLERFLDDRPVIPGE
jgi:hypothetical protein